MFGFHQDWRHFNASYQGRIYGRIILSIINEFFLAIRRTIYDYSSQNHSFRRKKRLKKRSVWKSIQVVLVPKTHAMWVISKGLVKSINKPFSTPVTG